MLYSFDRSQIEEGITVKARDIVDIIEDAGDWYRVSLNGEVRLEYDCDI